MEFICDIQSSFAIKQEQLIPYWHITRVAPSVIMMFSCLLGIPGNITVLVAAKRTLKRENFTLRLLLNLAMCDLLALLCMPLTTYNLWGNWSLGPIACKLLFFLLHSSLNASVLTITLLSVQRYVHVLYPQRWAQLGRLGEEALLMSLWGLAGVVASPSISIRDVESHGDQTSCSSHYKSDKHQAVILILQTFLGFAIPCCILVMSYFYLHKRVSAATLLRQRQLTKLVSCIVVSFFSFWTPLHSFNLVALGNLGLKSPTVERVCEAAWDFLIAFTIINSCLNPFFYAFTSSGFRKGSSPSYQHLKKCSASFWKT